MPRLAAGEKKEFKLKLLPAGSIVGRVVDKDSNPMLAQVFADNGTSMSISVGTDEKGQYRLSGLAPGKYRVKAKPVLYPLGMSQPVETRSDGTADTFEMSTYYPGVADRKSAARVAITSGLDAPGIDIQLVRSPVNHVAGKIFAMPAGMQRPSVQIREENGGSRAFAQSKPDGSFTFWRVDPGPGRVVAMGSAGKFMQTSPVDVEVGQENLENLELRVRQPERHHGPGDLRG